MPTIEVNGYPYAYTCEGAGAPTWVFLHGFLGSQADFASIKPQGTRIYLDLLGLGVDKPTVSDPHRFAAATQVAELHQFLASLNLKEIRLVGYSMGARLALAYALMYPEDLAQVILESGTPGLVEPQDRQDRQTADAAKAERIETAGMPAFIAEWEQLPMFASQQELPIAQQQFMHQQRVQQNPANVAASLREFGTGQMPNYWPDLVTLQVPVTLINGALDKKFLGIAERMQKQLEQSQQFVVPSVGHNVHFEAPEQYTAILAQL
ncbi:2-succinyl-6-hydroxy-2,4-cyclohexadiene-1-carboxylate synthase [Weissella viridescens]|uniref:Putative 2-succinyl-6-hydroxy-2,4-cyclohexadiene-1-carboxylate synthase n=1 Tax=Weissella viridescens TaxID=1629 RepID=A0A3P2RHD6_WEIVI|nr:2-succinyl-6-hydroxy-2,4-cyclohexadiene-1-carboxylate synthase [Weissella viridescens]RRG18821.1 2-succinyl-6-hydroxy-2,4-cyclohexadiene-1-carboxylate synthase [Weissella viridescens]